MKTNEMELREEPATTLCRILAMPVKHWCFVVALVLFFMALCAVVFAGEPAQQSGSCDLTSGLAATLNLSRTQCEKIQRLTDSFHNDTKITRGKIMEKRLELMRLSKNTEADPCAINNAGRELTILEQEFSRRAYRTEVDQRKLLTPEQINKMKDISYAYDSQGYGKRAHEKNNFRISNVK